MDVEIFICGRLSNVGRFVGDLKAGLNDTVTWFYGFKLWEFRDQSRMLRHVLEENFVRLNRVHCSHDSSVSHYKLFVFFYVVMM